jgi:hypothetical protein
MYFRLSKPTGLITIALKHHPNMLPSRKDNGHNIIDRKVHKRLVIQGRHGHWLYRGIWDMSEGMKPRAVCIGRIDIWDINVLPPDCNERNK